jgi:class 3 adenylate cyclase
VNLVNLKFFKFSAIALCIFFSISLSAQSPKTDSLIAVIELLEDDSVKVNALNELSLNLWDSNPDSSISYARDALALGNKIHFKKGVAYALKNIGLVHFMKSDYMEVLNYWNQSLIMFDSVGDKIGVSNILNNLGAVYVNQGDDAKAIEYNLRSLKVAEEIGDKLRIASAYLGIGNVYLNKVENHDKSLTYLQQALYLSEELGEYDAIGNASVNIGEIYFLKENYDSALLYYEKSLNAYKIDGKGNVPYSLNNIGKVYTKRGEYATAISYHQRAFNISEQINDEFQMAQSLIGEGDAYRISKDYKNALKPYKTGEELVKKIGALKELKEIYEGLSLANSALKNYNDAFNYQTLLTQINYDIYNADNDKQIERLQFSYDIDKKQGEVDLLTKDKALQAVEMQRQKVVKNAFIIGFILIILIAIGIYRNYKNKVKTNLLLDKQNHEIESLLLNILPAETAKELQKDGYATPRQYNSVSVLFTDFKGFTKIAEGLKPHELIAELNSFFNAFDDIIEKFHLEKIKTIGDAYMCAGGIPIANQTHPTRIVKAGLAMQEFMKNKNEQRIRQGMVAWELRVGIHTGPIVAGVVGKKKYAYDIWGDTVNIASRMESNGEVGKVNISSATYELVKNDFECSYRGKIEAKNKGFIDMYFLEHPKEAKLQLQKK